MPTRPVGIFDSGVGGLSVWREVRKQLPGESTIYLADQAHVPYGPRRLEEIRDYCDAITRYLLKQDCKAIIVACNTASAAALKQLRESFPGLPIIGMEPAVKPAAASTRTGVIGIMATQATFQGRLFTATAGRHAQHLRLINQVCHGLAEHVETGKLDGQLTEAILMRHLQPIMNENADTIVLACTHYPFLLPVIRKLVGDHIDVIDPAPAIARHLDKQLAEASIRQQEPTGSRHLLLTSGDIGHFRKVTERLIDTADCELAAVSWQEIKASTD